jgi:hypothetical protein
MPQVAIKWGIDIAISLLQSCDITVVISARPIVFCQMLRPGPSSAVMNAVLRCLEQHR